MKINLFKFRIDSINHEIDFWNKLKNGDDLSLKYIAIERLKGMYFILNELNLPLKRDKEEFKAVYENEYGEENYNE